MWVFACSFSLWLTSCPLTVQLQPQEISPPPTANLDRSNDKVYENVTGLVKAVIEMSSKIQPAPPEEYVPMVKVTETHLSQLSALAFRMTQCFSELHLKALQRLVLFCLYSCMLSSFDHCDMLFWFADTVQLFRRRNFPDECLMIHTLTSRNCFCRYLIIEVSSRVLSAYAFLNCIV